MGIRCGECSVCRCALESPDGAPDVDRAKPRSRAIRRQPGGHRHKRPWHVIPDGPQDTEYRYWHDHVPGFVR